MTKRIWIMAVVLAVLAVPAAARAQNTCISSAVCAYSEPGLGGQVHTYSVPSGGAFQITDPTGAHPDSVRNHEAGDLWLEDRQTEAVLCFPPGTWGNTNDLYGWAAWLSSGSSHNCTESAPGYL